MLTVCFVPDGYLVLIPHLYPVQDVQTFKFAAKPFAMICDTGTPSKEKPLKSNELFLKHIKRG